MVFSLIFYGAYLNKAGEKQISERIADERISVHAIKVKQHEMISNVKLPTLKFYTEKMTDAVTLSGGRIDQIFVKKNDFVREGQVICTIVDDEMPLKVRQAKTEIQSAEAKLKATENKYDRYQRLWDKKATSLSSLEEAELDYNTSVAELEDARVKLDQLLVQQSYMEVTAPISGNVITEYKTVGTQVDPGTPIVMVADFGELFCEMTVSDRIAKKLAADTTATFKFPKDTSSSFYDDSGRNINAYMDDTGFSVKAAIKEVRPSMSTPAEQRKIIWRIENSSGILEPKNYGNIFIKATKSYKNLAVPLDAVSNLSKPFVFVLGEDDTAKMREVEIGVTDGDYVEILSGLKEGEIVITSVTSNLLDGSKVKLKEVN